MRTLSPNGQSGWSKSVMLRYPQKGSICRKFAATMATGDQ
jgi:hypothetical protein